MTRYERSWRRMAASPLVLVIVGGLAAVGVYGAPGPDRPTGQAVPRPVVTTTETTWASTTTVPVIAVASTDTLPVPIQDGAASGVDTEGGATDFVPPAPQPSTGEIWATESTMYCLRGGMRNGEQVHNGAVAVNSSRYAALAGSSWTVLDGPMAGRTFTVKDMGPKAQFDMWTASCDQAINYGRRSIRVQRV